MLTLVNQSRAVAVTYALMGAWCLAAAGLMGAIALHDYLPWIVGAGLVLCLLAVLSFRFGTLRARARNIALGISACVALWRTADAAWLTLIDTMVAPRAVPGSILLGRWLLAAVLALCTYTLWKFWRASNNRWRGP